MNAIKMIILLIATFLVTNKNIAQVVAEVSLKEIPSKTNTKIAPFDQPAPRFPGGAEALANAIKDNLVYPEVALKNGVEGIVILEANVDIDGKAQFLKIHQSLCYSCDQAAIKAIEGLPNWEPSYLNGNAKTKKIRIPIQFRIR